MGQRTGGRKAPQQHKQTDRTEVEFWALAQRVTPYEPGQPYPGITQWMNRWKKLGAVDVVYWHDKPQTLEKQRKRIEEWLREHSIAHDRLVMRLIGPLH